MRTADTRACLFCIDGLMPAGTDPVFGQTYRRCPNCIDTCPDCEGVGFYPAQMRYFESLVDALYALGFEIDLCRQCLGVIDLYHSADGAP